MSSRPLNKYRVEPPIINNLDIDACLAIIGAELEIEAEPENQAQKIFIIRFKGIEVEGDDLKTAFMRLVDDLALLYEPRERHQRRLPDIYQFPAAIWHQHDAKTKITGWVVPMQMDKSKLYGVVRYIVDGDVAWIESKNMEGGEFNPSEVKPAIEWCKWMMSKMAIEGWK